MSTSEDRLHPAARDLLLLCVDAGWDATLSHGVDTGGSPYVSLRAARRDPEGYLDVTWHTRMTGTYRLFHCLIGRTRHSVRDSTLRRARSFVRGEPTGIGGRSTDGPEGAATIEH